jgi:hypothetical protein
MIRRLLPLLLVGLMLAVGLGTAQEPPGSGDGPLRLKKKKRSPDAPEAKAPAKQGKEPSTPKDSPPPGKDKAAEDDSLEPEDGRADPQEAEKAVLDRIGRNMRSVEEKLGNRELGDPTSQQQRDIVRDLESLIKNQQRNQGVGDDQQPQDKSGGGEQGQDKGKQGERRQQAGNNQSGQQRGSSRGKQGQRQRRQLSGRQRGRSSGQPKSGSEQGQPNSDPNADNNLGGGKSPENNKNINADLYKEVWGHLPESLRAEMSAYSNPSPFLPRYDELIKKYYRSIAEQGRKKGD